MRFLPSWGVRFGHFIDKISIASQVVIVIRNLSASAGNIRDVGSNPRVRKIPPEEGMSIHFSILAWRIPWTQEPGVLQSTGHRNLVGYSPQNHKESKTTEAT